MKRPSYLLIFTLLLLVTACKDPHQTGDATQDSGASHGYSGPAHPEKSEMNTGTSDTGRRDSNKNQPTDTSKHKINEGC